MDLQEQISFFERNRDWQGLVEELEKGLSGSSQNAVKASIHLKLGRVLETKFLQSVKALKHFQDAYKLNPALIEALEEARFIYWDLGKTGMVQKLLELELKSMQDGPKTAALLVELGDVYADQGDIEKATQTYARALAAAKGKNNEASACLEDVQVTEASWQDRVGQLLRTAHEAREASAKARLFVRAARVARRFAPEAMEGMLAQAYASDPTDRAAAALYENLLVEAQRTSAILEQQRQVLASIADNAARGDAALRFGTRWVTRHQNLEAGVELLQEAFAADPSNEAAFTFLREIWGTKEGNWERVVELLDRATQARPTNGSETFILAQAATLTWRQLGNMMRARAYFERLSAISPDHPSLKAFEKQIGEAIKPSATAAKPAAAQKPAAPPAKTAEPVRAPQASDPGASTPNPSPAAAAPATPAPVKAVATPADEGKIAELRAAAEKQEGAKRYNEFVRTLMQLASMVPDVAERVDLYQKAADLYVTKFANQAEAVKAYEAILDVDAENTKAIDFLRQMYEKRRDWEKLLGLQRRSAERLDPGRERASRFLEIARLATERVKKPDVCIDLWREVLESDAENAEALNNLAGLYERAKDFAALASVLEKQSEATHDTPQRIVILGKLAAIYGDRLENDEGAVAAWRTLLTLDPNDRKAQEALKKKYLALGRWDDLEVFYAESGKWDEFIRVLETQESRETEKVAKIGLLMKIAELWGDKKKKDDRAAKSYERVLELDAEHLAAAEALIPIYRQANNFRGLASAYEVKLRHETEPGTQLELYRELAGIYESRLKDAGKAFERFLLAFEIAPADEQCAEDLERSAKGAGRWEDVIKAYQTAVSKLEGEGDNVGAIALRLRLGRVLVDELGRVDLALTEFRSVYESDRENVAALGALERLYRQTSRFDELLEIYEKKRELAVDAADRREILYSIARLYEGEMKNPKKAIASYTAVLDDEPSDPVALKSLDVLYRDLKDYDAYADILRRRIELDLAEAELIDLKFRLGRTLELHLKDAAAALDNYREILFLDPDTKVQR